MNVEHPPVPRATGDVGMTIRQSFPSVFRQVIIRLTADPIIIMIILVMIFLLGLIIYMNMFKTMSI